MSSTVTTVLSTKHVSKVHALAFLILAAFVVNQFIDPIGTYLLASAFLIWFIAGDGLTQAKITWAKFLAWLPG
jgi:hypothetical protein